MLLSTPPRAPTLADLRARRDDILALAERYGATHVRVFGSVARGDASPDSDIDLLVDWDYVRVSWGGVDLRQTLETLLGCSVDIVSEKWLNPHLRDRVLKEAEPLGRP